MSLVVAEAHDEGVTLVADTKITVDADARRTRRVLEFALPKVVILDASTVVGYAGPDPLGLLRNIVGWRGHPVERILASAEALAANGASFVVAALDPAPQLWRVADAVAESRQAVGRAWVGDQDAYAIFQQKYHEWSDDVEASFRLLSSMQFLTSFDVAPSVGGYVTRIGTSTEGFRFVADRSTILPWRMVSQVALDRGSMRVKFSVPPGGDPNSYSMLMAVGRQPTIGALAYLIPEARSALLFRADTPWDPVRLDVCSMNELTDRAGAEHGQTLSS